jgi:hypothetical protein
MADAYTSLDQPVDDLVGTAAAVRSRPLARSNGPHGRGAIAQFVTS